jgi:hypothetical protein
LKRELLKELNRNRQSNQQCMRAPSRLMYSSHTKYKIVKADYRFSIRLKLNSTRRKSETFKQTQTQGTKAEKDANFHSRTTWTPSRIQIVRRQGKR